MRLIKFRLTNYRPILDSGEVKIESTITQFLGKNESGKTYLLRGLESFNRDYQYTRDDLCLNSDINSSQSEKDKSKSELLMITLWFEINTSDKEKFIEISEEFQSISTLIVKKFFGGSYSFESPEISISEIAVNRLNNQISDKVEEMTKMINKLYSIVFSKVKPDAPGSTEADLKNILSRLQSFERQQYPMKDATMGELLDELAYLDYDDYEINTSIEEFVDLFRINLEALHAQKNQSGDLQKDILQLLPQFSYSSDVDLLEDKLPLDDFIQKKVVSKTFLNLLKVSKLNIKNIIGLDEYRRKSAITSASDTITKLLNDAWIQDNTLQILIDIDPPNVVNFIRDDVINEYHAPSFRSQGFQWFLSFYINYTAQNNTHPENTIFLFDDPGMHLHPSGQKDLLRELTILSNHNQVIFTTHSPFMIDRKLTTRIRIVSKEVNKCTVVSDKIYTASNEAFEPIRASIGMTIGDSFAYSNNVVIVEGFSDELILEGISYACQQNGEQSLENKSIDILPANGTSKVCHYSSLLTSQRIPFFIILDSDEAGDKCRKELIEKYFIEEARILQIGSIKSGATSIEDLINIKYYLQAINNYYSDILISKKTTNPLKTSDLSSSDFKGIIKFFKENKLGSFDKIAVAKTIVEMVHSGNMPSQGTLNSFSKGFNIICQSFD